MEVKMHHSFSLASQMNLHVAHHQYFTEIAELPPSCRLDVASLKLCLVFTFLACSFTASLARVISTVKAIAAIVDLALRYWRHWHYLVVCYSQEQVWRLT